MRTPTSGLRSRGLESFQALEWFTQRRGGRSEARRSVAGKPMCRSSNRSRKSGFAAAIFSASLLASLRLCVNNSTLTACTHPSTTRFAGGPHPRLSCGETGRVWLRVLNPSQNRFRTDGYSFLYRVVTHTLSAGGSRAGSWRTAPIVPGAVRELRHHAAFCAPLRHHFPLSFAKDPGAAPAGGKR